MMPAPTRRAFATRHDSEAQDQENQTGLLFDVTIDRGDPKRCIATFTLSAALLSAPGVTHSGLMFTAMERFATRVPILLRDDRRDVWLLRTASITHYRAAHPDLPIAISGVIEWDGVAGEPIVVHVEACDSRGGLLADADFTILPVPLRRHHQVPATELASGAVEIVQRLVHGGRAD